MLKRSKTVIAVIGASSCDDIVAGKAYETGRLIAERGCILLNGGGQGVMLSSARGAKEAGGLTVGIIPSADKTWANPFIDIVIATGMGQARNAQIVQTADGIIAVGGAYGTLSETAFALSAGRPIAGIGSWDRLLSEIPSFELPEHALDFVLKKIEHHTQS